jgi:hypothetical protein
MHHILWIVRSISFSREEATHIARHLGPSTGKQLLPIKHHEKKKQEREYNCCHKTKHREHVSTQPSEKLLLMAAGLD